MQEWKALRLLFCLLAKSLMFAVVHADASQALFPKLIFCPTQGMFSAPRESRCVRSTRGAKHKTQSYLDS